MRSCTRITIEGAEMNIGAAARAAGLSAKMIRHYEAGGLLPPAARSAAGYRRYGPRELDTLRFIRRARAAGFGLAQVRALLALWQDRERPAREVKRLAQQHLADTQRRIAELQAIAASLSYLVAHCHGDARPDCPILDALAEPDGRGRGR
jgi:Cu(I)-responsive transcriptional regulator